MPSLLEGNSQMLHTPYLIKFHLPELSCRIPSDFQGKLGNVVLFLGGGCLLTNQKQGQATGGQLVGSELRIVGPSS